MVAGELVALLMIVTLPVAAPVDVGAKLTVNLADCPDVKVVFDATPLALYPGPEAVTCEIVMLEFPVFVTVMFCELVLPGGTFPKLRLVGFKVKISAVDTPVPLSGMERGEAGALLARLIPPLVFPVVFGAKETLNVVLPLGVMVVGMVSPEMLKPAPDTPACASVSGAVP